MVTMKDVAKAAGVSQATILRAVECRTLYAVSIEAICTYLDSLSSEVA